MVASCAHAASLDIQMLHPTDKRVYSIFLNGGPDNGAFDTVHFHAAPDAPATIANIVGLGFTLRPPGQRLTYRNLWLDLDPTDPDNPGGLGWAIIGSVRTPTQFSFTGGPLGQKINTAGQPDGTLFLANIYLPAGTARGYVQLINAGSLVQQLDFTLPVPEPVGSTLAGMGVLFGIAGWRCRPPQFRQI